MTGWNGLLRSWAGRLRRGEPGAGLKVVSGGQAGVDRAALDAAMDLGLAVGGWCPRGRRAEDGPIDDRYPLRQTGSTDYAVRTRLNVDHSDATLVLSRGRPTGGSALTVALAQEIGRPCLTIDLAGAHSGDVETVRAWLRRHRVRVLNVAGPRESTAPGIYPEAKRFLTELLSAEGATRAAP